MKNIIKQWLGIDEIEDVLKAPESGFGYIGGEIDKVSADAKKQAKEEAESAIKSKFARIVECHECGVLLRMKHATQEAVFSKDVQDGDTLTPYHLTNAFYALGGCSEHKEQTEVVFFCNRCRKPKKK